MNTPTILRTDSHHTASFGAATPVAEPLGEPIAQTRMAQLQHSADQKVSTGLWECTPGVWRRQVLKQEFSHIVEGQGVFTPDGGTPVAFQAGDALYFPANSFGTWQIEKTVRKTFVIFE